MSEQRNEPRGPLDGVRVADFSRVLAGPYATMTLADFGADVIKVEAPEGDSSRYTGVPRHRGMSGTFQHNARGKRSIAIDLKQERARETIMRLVPKVDAFASNIRPRALERLGLDYESVRKANPGIVYLNMVGYGSGGRYAGRPAYDDLIQAASAIPTLLQKSTGQPRFIPMAAIDRIVGGA
ncbi:MAG: CoA transferase, partial [Actinobacteria bacterium]|nr:CoA transferase [Actinomycetota bacterium]